MAPTLTLSRAAVTLHGLTSEALQGPVLPEAAHALAAVLTARDFELTSPIVRGLPDFQSFRLAQ
jgi:hypothetical protein